MSSNFTKIIVNFYVMKKNICMNRIRDLREDRDLRQIDVAKATDIDQQTLSNYETGKTNPDSFAIIQLAEFFGVTCDYLLGVTDRNLNNTDDVMNEIENIKAQLDYIKRYLKKN